MDKACLAAIAATAVCASFGSAQAASLVASSETPTAIFNTEIKRDQVISTGGNSGQDVFLRDGDNSPLVSTNRNNWGPSGTSYNFSLGYDGDIATLAVDGASTLMLDIDTDGVWNAVSFFVRADQANQYSSATTTLTITEANGMALDSPFTASGTIGSQFSGLFALDTMQVLSSISGFFQFDFVATGAGGSPNSRLAVNIAGANVPVNAVPVPAALPLLLTGIAGLGFVARRRKAAAA